MKIKTFWFVMAKIHDGKLKVALMVGNEKDGYGICKMIDAEKYLNDPMVKNRWENEMNHFEYKRIGAYE